MPFSERMHTLSMFERSSWSYCLEPKPVTYVEASPRNYCAMQSQMFSGRLVQYFYMQCGLLSCPTIPSLS